MPVSKPQILQLLKLINTNYPNNKYEVTDGLVNTWQALLGHYDFTAIQAATMKTFGTCKFPPVAADIIGELKGLMALGLPSKGEAWEIACDAVAYCGLARYEKGERVLTDRSPLVLEAVKQLGGLQAIDEANNAEVIRGQFMRIYEELLGRTVERGVTSPAVLEAARLLGHSAQRMLTGGGADDDFQEED